MHSNIGGGNIRITIVEAKLSRDTEIFSKMDPYCVIDYNGNKYKTVTHKSGGKFPKWNHVIIYTF